MGTLFAQIEGVMFFALVIVAGLFLVLVTVMFLIDAFKVHWGWGLAVMFLPFAYVVCLFKHWAETKRGFLLTLLAVPFLVGAFLTMPKPAAKGADNKPGKINDPFFNAIQRARLAVEKTKESRKEESTSGGAADVSAPGAVAGAPAAAKPTSALTVPQRLANNRAAFKMLETDFATLNAKRKALPKSGGPAVAAFNRDAKAYADKLAEARSEQAILLELQRTAQK